MKSCPIKFYFFFGLEKPTRTILHFADDIHRRIYFIWTVVASFIGDGTTVPFVFSQFRINLSLRSKRSEKRAPIS
jgi:hypothetical protein